MVGLPYVVPAWIPLAPLLLVVGQSPGRDEGKAGRPFVGMSGKILRRVLRGVGLHPDDDVMYTNITDLFHPEVPNYVPTPKEVKEGMERIKGELECAPSVRCVLLLGASASHLAFRGRMGEISGRSGTLWGLPVFATYHPAAMLHSTVAATAADIERQIRETVGRAAGVCRGEDWTVRLPPYELVETEVKVECS